MDYVSVIINMYIYKLTEAVGVKGRIREIRILDLILYFLVPLLALCLTTVGCVLFCVFVKEVHIAFPIIATVIISYFPLKYFAIGLVLVYKAFAPLSVRERCRFQPTCSTYMIMAIQKYGLIRGVFKGFKRLLRCKPPNGGQDLP